MKKYEKYRKEKANRIMKGKLYKEAFHNFLQ